MPRGRVANANTINVEMAFEYATKRTYRFNAIDEDSPIKNVYIDQTAFPNGQPESITVVINV